MFTTATMVWMVLTINHINTIPILCNACGAYPTTSCSTSSCGPHNIRRLRPLLPTPRWTVQWPQPTARVLTPHSCVRNRVSSVVSFLCSRKKIEKIYGNGLHGERNSLLASMCVLPTHEPICVGFPTSHGIIRNALVCKPACQPGHIQ
jgi:hypothetical protein